jgi:hypothetical protein
MLCPALGLLSLLKFVLTLTSLDRRREFRAAEEVVVLVRADGGIDCGELVLFTAYTYDLVRLTVGETLV